MAHIANTREHVSGHTDGQSIHISSIVQFEFKYCYI